LSNFILLIIHYKIYNIIHKKDIKQIAESISKHQFEKSFEYFREDITWNMIGGEFVSGKEAVIKTCEESAKYLSGVKTTFHSFNTRIVENTVIIESSADYFDENNGKSAVASCDIYDFQEGKLQAITSYNIEITQVS
jgi:hypothetical protein